MVHAYAYRLFHPPQDAHHPFRDRLAPQQESPFFSGFRAVVRENQEVEGLRSAQSTLLPILLGKPSKLDEPGLVGVYLQSEAFEPPPCSFQKPLRVPRVLKSQHEIVGVSHNDCVASASLLRHFLRQRKMLSRT